MMNPSKLRYRINFGNGQIHETPNGTKAECAAWIRLYGDAYTAIEPNPSNWCGSGRGTSPSHSINT